MVLEDPILIIGAPRSGTSLTAGIIEACGAFGGASRFADSSNPKGYFENDRLLTFFNDIVMENAWLFLHAEDDLTCDVSEIRRRVEEMLQSDGYAGGPWYFKYPNALNHFNVLKTMATIFPNAKWVVPRRRDEDIMASARKYFREHAHNPIGGLLKNLSQIKRAAPNCIEIWPFEILAQGAEGFKSTIEELGLTWNEEAVKAFADPSLVHYDAQGLFCAA